MKTLKCIIVGASGTGKTSYVNYIHANHLSYYKGEPEKLKPSTSRTEPTILLDFKVINHYVKNDKTKLKIHFYDSGGQERYGSIIESYINQYHNIIIMLSIADFQSMNIAKKWINTLKNRNHIVVMVMANKIDIIETEYKDEIQSIQRSCEELGFLFYEISAKNGTLCMESWDSFLQMSSQLQHSMEIQDKVPLIEEETKTRHYFCCCCCKE